MMGIPIEFVESIDVGMFTDLLIEYNDMHSNSNQNDSNVTTVRQATQADIDAFKRG